MWIGGSSLVRKLVEICRWPAPTVSPGVRVPWRRFEPTIANPKKAASFQLVIWIGGLVVKEGFPIHPPQQLGVPFVPDFFVEHVLISRW